MQLDDEETLVDTSTGERRRPRRGPRPGDRIAERFTLKGQLGHGAMGTVWRAHHGGLDTDVALKLIIPEIRESHSIAERFFREARVLAKINHPNVVRVLDVSLPDDPLPYLAMELLEGRDLRSYLDEKGALSVAEATYIVLQLLEGLEAAHEKKVVHRDLKPANIFLAQAPKAEYGYRVVIVDFGTALGLDDLDQRMTRAGIAIGTPLYMSPEQAVGDTPTETSDLYATAIIFYELLSQQVPHETDDLRTMMARRSIEAAAPIRQFCPKLPSSFDPLFRRALATDRGERFPDATAFRMALEAIAADGELPAGDFDHMGFADALDAAVDATDANPPATASTDRTPTSSSLPAEDPPTPRVDAPPVAEVPPSALELDYEAAGLEPPGEAPEPQERARRPLPRALRNLLALAGASASAYGVWIARGGAAAESLEHGPILETAFTWVGVFIVAVVLFSRADERSG